MHLQGTETHKQGKSRTAFHFDLTCTYKKCANINKSKTNHFVDHLLFAVREGLVADVMEILFLS